jgi:hypothetical protein
MSMPDCAGGLAIMSHAELASLRPDFNSKNGHKRGRVRCPAGQPRSWRLRLRNSSSDSE